MFHLSRFLNQEHWAVILYGSLLTIAVALGSRKLNKVLLPIYNVYIVYDIDVLGNRNWKTEAGSVLVMLVRHYLKN